MSEPAGNLEERVSQFQRLQLPGQPQMMHMAIAYLVQDLWNEVQRLRSAGKGTGESDGRA